MARQFKVFSDLPNNSCVAVNCSLVTRYDVVAVDTNDFRISGQLADGTGFSPIGTQSFSTLEEACEYLSDNVEDFC